MNKQVSAMIGGMQRFSVEDGPGIRTTIFLKGCPLACAWCHNPDMISFQPQLMLTPSRCIGCGACRAVCPLGAINIVDSAAAIDFARCDNCLACADACCTLALKTSGIEMTVEQVMSEIRRDAGYYTRTGGGLTISGGEPLAQGSFCWELIQVAGQEGISVAIDTSGYGDSFILLQLAQQADWLLYDIKALGDSKHRQYTGVSNAVILENLALLAADDSLREKIIIRLPLIQGVNDADADMLLLIGLMHKLSLRQATLLPYHPLGLGKSRGIGQEQTEFAPPSARRLKEITALFAANKIHADHHVHDE